MRNVRDKEREIAMVNTTAFFGMVRIVKEVMHRLGWCDAPYWAWDPPPTCPVCLEEAEERERQAHFRAWDGIGLGYVGPGSGPRSW